MRSVMALLVALGMAGCSVPFVGGPSDDELKAPCDRLAARAIQTSSFEDAKNFAARASDCYASLQTR